MKDVLGGEADAILTSPPYADSQVGSGGERRTGWRGYTDFGGGTYATPGQVGALRAGPCPGGEAGVGDDVEMLEWGGCYSQGWGRTLLSPGAFAHPAKFACGLLTRLYDHGFARGWWAKGSLVVDPFGGVGCGGVVAAYRGLRWVGVELEPRFIALAEETFGLHRGKWLAAGDTPPVILRGDSRQFAALVAGAAACVTSPPYANGCARTGGADPHPERLEGHQLGAVLERYGTAPGNVGNLPAGDADGVVTSPPWEDGGMGDGRFGGGLKDKAAVALRSTGGGGLTDYGNAPGQVGALRQETYWDAVRCIYGQCLLALGPGGVACVVVKGFVRKRAVVDLPGQTWRLLLSLGFTPVGRIRCLLTEETREPSLFGGEEVRRRSRASFFRRLAEKKGAPPIDAEEVLVVRKPSRTEEARP
jgi:hypothetical protein